jgi:hypothetical protein
VNLEGDFAIAEQYRTLVLGGLPLTEELIDWFDAKVRMRMLGRKMAVTHAESDVVGSFCLGFDPFGYQNHMWLVNHRKTKARTRMADLRKESV